MELDGGSGIENVRSRGRGFLLQDLMCGGTGTVHGDAIDRYFGRATTRQCPRNARNLEAGLLIIVKPLGFEEPNP